MRLFVAVEIGQEIASAAGTLIDALRRRARALAPHARFTWISPERLHITVRFIGQADDARHREIAALLESPLHTAPFELSLAGAGTFPQGGPPKVVWAGVFAGSEGLRQLEREVTGRLERTGVAPEGRAYSPHLTLARVREAGGLRSGPFLEGSRDIPLGTTRVEAITLFESRLSPKGPTYVPLLRTPLGGPEGPPLRT